MRTTSTISTENFFKDSLKKVILKKDREIVLCNISKEIANEYLKNKPVNLNFICTHNSRRSQLAQVWSFFAAHYFNLKIHAFSGGTEVTSFHRNTVKTLQKVGFSFNLEDFSHQNPKYEVSFNGTNKTLLVFSKRFDYHTNPESFIAITTCSDADKNCLFIPDAIHRFHLPFDDPKMLDGTDLQSDSYLKISQQIAAELFFIFSKVKKIVS